MTALYITQAFILRQVFSPLTHRVSAGELSIIQNEALRAALYEFDALSDVAEIVYKSVQSDRRELRRLIASAFLYDQKSVGDAFRSHLKNTEIESDVSRGTFVPDAFYNNPEFRTALNGAGILDLNMQALAEQQKEIMVRINQLINEELAKPSSDAAGTEASL